MSIERLQRTLMRYTDAVSPEDINAVIKTYGLIAEKGLVVGDLHEDWVYDGHDEHREDYLEEYCLDRLLVHLLLPPVHIMVSEAYGVDYSTELGYPRCIEEQAKIHELVEEWTKEKLARGAGG